MSPSRVVIVLRVNDYFNLYDCLLKLRVSVTLLCFDILRPKRVFINMYALISWPNLKLNSDEAHVPSEINASL